MIDELVAASTDKSANESARLSFRVVIEPELRIVNALHTMPITLKTRLGSRSIMIEETRAVMSRDPGERVDGAGAKTDHR